MTTALAETNTQIGAEKSAEAEHEADGITQIVSFRLANEEYGVDIMRVQEIILVGQITRMPQVPDFISGLINLRGHVIPIVDLRKRFKMRSHESTEHTRIIVVNVHEKTIGIVVDAVNEVLRIGADQVEPPPASVTGVDHEYLMGLIRLDEKLVILLDIQNILTDVERKASDKETTTPA